jgi:hypothetical protein
MGRVKSSSLFSFETTKCPCYLFAGSVNRKCCADEHDIIKIEDDHAASLVVSIVPDFFEIGPLFESIQLTDNPGAHVNQKVEESPPPLSHIPLFAKHCSLVFYDDDLIG